jgi:hypothetical protein
MNLDKWDVAGDEHCSNAGSSDRGHWIESGYPDIRTLNGTPPGTAPTYVCGDTGHSAANWQDLHDQEGEIKLFPVNDCAGQLDMDGNPAPCPATPDKYDIIGFTSLLVQHVYHGNDLAAIGTPGAGGTCTKNKMTIPGSTTVDLDTILAGSPNTSGTCPAVAPDTIALADVHVYEDVNKGAEYVRCAPSDPGPCDYVYDESTHVITWLTGSAPDKKVVFTWSTNGHPGACGIHPSDPNAICLVTEWRGFTTGPGPIGGGENFGPGAVQLCELTYAAGCPDQG